MLSTDVSSVPHWRHRIRLPDGTLTPGTQDTESQLAVMQLPTDLTGKRVLDIGCSDGFFAFECERRGASEVIGVDNYSSVFVDSPSGFSIAKSLLGSRVELIEDDFMTMDLHAIGKFDLVLFLGVLYHLRHPLLGLERIASVCRNQTILETATQPPAAGWRKWFDRSPEHFMRFAGPSGSKDATNWWFPTVPCVEEMLRSCGFCNVSCVDYRHGRAFVHGFAPAGGMSITEHAEQQQVTAERRSKEWVRTRRKTQF
jgi:tRNA (mo5U34)-methyltransferase